MAFFYLHRSGSYLSFFGYPFFIFSHPPTLTPTPLITYSSWRSFSFFPLSHRSPWLCWICSSPLASPCADPRVLTLLADLFAAVRPFFIPSISFFCVSFVSFVESLNYMILFLIFSQFNYLATSFPMSSSRFWSSSVGLFCLPHLCPDGVSPCGCRRCWSRLDPWISPCYSFCVVPSCFLSLTV